MWYTTVQTSVAPYLAAQGLHQRLGEVGAGCQALDGRLAHGLREEERAEEREGSESKGVGTGQETENASESKDMGRGKEGGGVSEKGLAIQGLGDSGFRGDVPQMMGG